MSIDPNQTVAVLTGEIVTAPVSSPEERSDLWQVIRGQARRIRDIFPDAVPFEMDFSRKDGWQLLLAPPKVCVRIGLFHQAGIRSMMEGKVDTRLAIAVGPAGFVEDRVSQQGEGLVYQDSVEALESMSSRERLTIRLSNFEAEVQHAVKAVGALIDALTSEWTSRQALAVSGALIGMKHESIASLWPEKISAQAVGKHLERANWWALTQGIEYLESLLAKNE